MVTKNKSDDGLDRLLGGKDGLSVTEKERIFRGVLRRGPLRNRLFARWRGAPFLALASGLIVMVALVPRFFLSHHRHAPSSDSEFTARGGGALVHPLLDLSCVGGTPQAGCPRGGKLLFRLSGLGEMHAFAAAAVAEDGSNEVVWYFPAEEQDRSVNLQDLPPSGVLAQGVVLGPEHRSGTYKVYGIFTDVPRTKTQLRSALEATVEHQPTGGGVLVVEVPLKVAAP